MKIMLLLLIVLCLLSGCENPNKTYINIQTIDYEIVRREVLEETVDAYLVNFASYETYLPKNSDWIWLKGGICRDKARFIPEDKIEELIAIWKKERGIW